MVILVVEDEVAIRGVEVAYLIKEGYQVVDTDDGRLALELFYKRKIDLVVLDLNLPGMNGLDVCRKIRAQSNIPILIVTAKSSDEDEVRGLEIGADDYIKKPFNPKVLTARVKALLRKHGGAVIEYGELTIDTDTMSVYKRGDQISFTTTRFNLLLALVSQPNVVLSRQQLVEKIYNDAGDHFVYERTIDAHIKAIRKLLEDDPKNPRYIHTVIGSGYKFSGERHAR